MCRKNIILNCFHLNLSRRTLVSKLPEFLTYEATATYLKTQGNNNKNKIKNLTAKNGRFNWNPKNYSP